jgi:hypothetical protein
MLPKGGMVIPNENVTEERKPCPKWNLCPLKNDINISGECNPAIERHNGRLRVSYWMR